MTIDIEDQRMVAINGGQGMSRKPWRPIPPVYFLVAILIMLALNKWAPLTRLVSPPWNSLGIVLIVAGFGFGCWGALLFRLRGTTPRPFTESAKLVTEGPYRISRNPMYFGLAVVLVGLVLLLGTLTSWSVIIVFVWLIQTFVIRVEEAMLAEKFGPQYAAYCSQVRRWI